MSAITTLEEMEVEIAVDLLEAQVYKDYRPGFQYAVKIVAALNQMSPLGQVQVQLDIAAVKDDGSAIKKTSRHWINYPVASGTVETKREHLLRSRDDMARILRAQSDYFNAYGSIDGSGAKRLYFDRDGNRLDSDGVQRANAEALNRVIAELNLRLKDASRWLGLAGYAVFTEFTRTNSGKVVRQFQNFQAKPDQRFPLLDDPGEFLA